MNRKLISAFTLLLTAAGFIYARQPDKTCRHYIPWGGQRVESENRDFAITRAIIINGVIQVHFSKPVNPSSVKKENIHINDEKLSETAQIKFGRSGRYFEITGAELKAEGEENYISFEKILSFSKEELTQVKAKLTYIQEEK